MSDASEHQSKQHPTAQKGQQKLSLHFPFGVEAHFQQWSNTHLLFTSWSHIMKFVLINKHRDHASLCRLLCGMLPFNQTIRRLFTHPAAWLAIDDRVWAEALWALQVGKRFDSPPGFQVTGHTYWRTHLQTIVHTMFRSAAGVQRWVLRLKTQRQDIVHLLLRVSTYLWNPCKMPTCDASGILRVHMCKLDLAS